MSEQAEKYQQRDPKKFRPISERVAKVKEGIANLPHNADVRDTKGNLRYKYTDSNALLDDVRPRLAAEQLDLIPDIIDFTIDSVTTVDSYGKEKVIREATMKLELSFSCPGTLDPNNITGETREKPTTWFVTHRYDGTQTIEAMITYAEKMFLKGRLQISTGADIEQGDESGQQRTNGQANGEKPIAQQQASQPPQQPAQAPAQPRNGTASNGQESAEVVNADFRSRLAKCKTRDDMKAFERWWDENTERFSALPQARRDQIQADYQQRLGKLHTPDAQGQPA